MDPKHRDILIRKRSELVENLNTRDGLFTQLIARKVLNQRMVRTIRNGRSPDEQSEELLDILPTRGSECFNKFCEALIADDQESIVTEFLKPKSSEQVSNEEHRGVKRTRSPSPTELCIKNTKEGDISLKYISQYGNPERLLLASKRPYTKNEQMFLSKHFILDPLASMSQTPQFIPVPTQNHQQCSETGSPSVQKLARCDSIDTMRNLMPRRDSQSTESEIKGDNSRVESDSYVSVIREVVSNEQRVICDNMVDNDIDLTDGPVNVCVERSTRQFFIENHRKSYPMNKIPRGEALIINVNEVTGKPPRRGTDIDRDNIHFLLLQLHFNVTVYNDTDGLTAREILEKVTKFSKSEKHEESNASFICLLSHGEEGYIYGTDGEKIALGYVFSLFDNNRCTGLRGKPKIFIVQACRGETFDRGVSLDETDGSPVVKQVPTLSDMIIGYPTQAGYYAWRNRERGSWYIEAIVKVFMKHAKHDDICTLFNRVNAVVSKKISRTPTIHMDQMSQMSEYKSSLRMPHVYLFPGIGSG
ncbi:hypothetical protein SNE40_015542 [Patella caerulea]|uniref:Caspase-3 n=1 Tax=Patella caerulea TaxID=87958 RepID=A0AAN8JKW3_PATCE